MVHPIGSDKYADRVSRARVNHIAGGTDRAGSSDAVRTQKIAAGRKDGGAVNRADGGAITGSNVKARADRPSRKHGGKTGKKQFGGPLPPAPAAAAPAVQAALAARRGPGTGPGLGGVGGLGPRPGWARGMGPGTGMGMAGKRGGKVKRADGGKVSKGKKGATQVNVIIHDRESPQAGPMPMPVPVPGGPPPGLPPGLAGGAPPPIPPRPPMAGPPGPGGPPILPPRKRGGKVGHGDEAADRKLINKMLMQHEKKEMEVEGKLRHRARGGKADSDEKQDRALFKRMMVQHEKEEGDEPMKRARGGFTPVPTMGTKVFGRSLKNATPISHQPMKGREQANLGRKKPITYKTGGSISSEKGPMGPDLGGGALGGTARLEKTARAKRKYATPKGAHG